MESALRLAYEGQIALIMQKNAKQHVIANMHFGLIFSEVIGKISVAGLKAVISNIGSDFSKTGMVEVCML